MKRGNFIRRRAAQLPSNGWHIMKIIMIIEIMITMIKKNNSNNNNNNKEVR